MKRWSYWTVIGAVLLALVALIGWASAYSPLLTPRAAAEWSRGRLLGVTPVNNAVDVQAAPDGGAVLAWVDLDDRLHVARMGTRGQIVLDRTPGLGADLPREPHFLVGPEGEIHLVWRETGQRRSLLMYARLDDAVSVQVGPLPLSLPGDHARFPCLAFNSRDGIEVFWTGRSGVYRVALDAQGEGQGEPVLLIEGGQDVSVQVDQHVPQAGQQGRGAGDQHVGSKPRGFSAQFPLQADDSSQQHRQQDPADHFDLRLPVQLVLPALPDRVSPILPRF